VIADNPQVRVLRLRLAPNAQTPTYRHTRPIVSVFLTDARLQIAHDGAIGQASTHAAHDAVWGEPATQQVKNLSSEPVELIVTELKMR